MNDHLKHTVFQLLASADEEMTAAAKVEMINHLLSFDDVDYLTAMSEYYFSSVKKDPPKCECGIDSYYGKDVISAENHKDYCPKYIEWRKEEDEKKKGQTSVSYRRS